MFRLKLYPVTVMLSMLALVAGACAQLAPVPTPTPTPAPSPALTPAPTPTPTLPAPGLTLTISEPQDEAVVKENLIRVIGRTAPDAVVSVNGHIIRAINEGGDFTAVISLAEGPNLVEVIATDYQGNEVNQMLTVIYAPQG